MASVGHACMCCGTIARQFETPASSRLRYPYLRPVEDRTPREIGKQEIFKSGRWRASDRGPLLGALVGLPSTQFLGDATDDERRPVELQTRKENVRGEKEEVCRVAVHWHLAIERSESVHPVPV